MESEQLSPSLSEGSLPESDGENHSQQLKVTDISPENDGKLMKEIIRVGKGWETPSNGDKVQVHYVGRLTDGTVFDSSRDRNEQFSFELGSNQVIAGWEFAIKTMKRGELAVFTIAPELAYGEMGSPPKIPSSATLVFEIELFDWKLEDLTKKKDGGVTKRIITDGEGYGSPNDGATCEVNIIGKYNDRIFENRDVTFCLGEGCEEKIIEGVEIAIRKMKRRETAEVHIKPQYAFGYNGRKEFEIPHDYEEVVYEITLKNFEKIKETYEMDNNERIEQSELSKTKGTKYFKESKHKLAIKQYKRIVQYLGPPNDFDDDLKSRKDHLLLAGHLNLALCYIKTKEFSDAIKQCDSALSIDANNEKGLFRRGLAYFGQKDYDLAKKDFNTVLELDPGNKAARNELIACNNALKAQIEKEKSTYRNMFEIFAKRDVEKAAKMKDSSDVWIKEEKQSDHKKISGDVLSEVQMIDDDTKNMTIPSTDASQHP